MDKKTKHTNKDRWHKWVLYDADLDFVLDTPTPTLTWRFRCKCKKKCRVDIIRHISGDAIMDVTYK